MSTRFSSPPWTSMRPAELRVVEHASPEAMCRRARVTADEAPVAASMRRGSCAPSSMLRQRPRVERARHRRACVARGRASKELPAVENASSGGRASPGMFQGGCIKQKARSPCSSSTR
jgi:hypothetical protein